MLSAEVRMLLSIGQRHACGPAGNVMLQTAACVVFVKLCQPLKAVEEMDFLFGLLKRPGEVCRLVSDSQSLQLLVCYTLFILHSDNIKYQRHEASIPTVSQWWYTQAPVSADIAAHPALLCLHTLEMSTLANHQSW